MRFRLASGGIALACIAVALLWQSPPPEPAWSLPGAPPAPPALAERLEAGRLAADRPVRTRHVDGQGRPLFVNRLLFATSPYLLQHAHNPVSWFPWGPEAFAEAKRLGRPVLLSVGYATCHWCHVMEEESFEDVSIATLINERYVAIKLDREERPDLDAVYMTAVRGFTGGRGGWPMTVWLTDEGAPFYAATYVPPEDGMRGRPTGLRTMLARLADLYAQEPEKVALTTLSVRESITRTLTTRTPAGPVPADLEDKLIAAASASYDSVHGGARGAPKFPSQVPIRALLRLEEPHADLGTHTLEAMAAGGLYDHLGGGFHRYTVDARWRVPHFEKMLYDNALHAIAYTEAAQRDGDPAYERVARETLDMLLRDFAHPDGGLISAIDADSLDPEGASVEGAFYTWTPAELATVLSPARAKAFATTYQVSAHGDLDGRSVLRTDGLINDETWSSHTADRTALLAVRSERSPPIRDTKILAGLNGLAISALARAARVFREPRYAAAAGAIADTVWTRQVIEGRVRRVWTPTGAHHDGQLEDYAFLAGGLVDLFELTGDARWLTRAQTLDAAILAHFSDPESGGLYASPDDGAGFPEGTQDLGRERSRGDGAVPAGASVHALTLLKLGELTGETGYHDRARRLIEAQGPALAARPASHAELLLAADWLLHDPQEIVLITPERADGEALREVLAETFLPRAVFVDVTADQAHDLAADVPLVRDREPLGGVATVYVCQGGVCQQPVTDPAVLRAQLALL